MKSKEPKTLLGSALYLFGSRLTNLLTLNGRAVAKPQESQQVEKREPSIIATHATRRQRRKEAIAKRKQSRRRLRNQLSTGRKYVKGIITAFGLVVSLVASLAGIDSYVASRISISRVDTLDSSDPFFTLFEVFNEGYLSIYDVTTACYVKQAKSDTGPDVVFDETLINEKITHADEIAPMDKSTVRCLFPQGGVQWGVDEIYIIVKYRLILHPVNQEKVARFLGVLDAKGVHHWIQRPFNEHDGIVEAYEKRMQEFEKVKSGDLR